MCHPHLRLRKAGNPMCSLSLERLPVRICQQAAQHALTPTCPVCQVAAIVMRANSPRTACKRMLRHALRGWQALKAADNIAAVVVALHWQHQADEQQQADEAQPGSPSQDADRTALPVAPTGPSQGDEEAASNPGPIRSQSGQLAGGPIRGRSERGALRVMMGCEASVTGGDPESWSLQSGRMSRVVRSSKPDSFGFMECEA